MAWRTVIASLPLAANSGQYCATVASGIEPAPLDQQVGAHRRDALGRRVHERDRVGLPGRAVGRVGETAPEIHDGPAVDVHAYGRADLAPFVEVLGERVEHRLEVVVDPTADRRRRHGAYPTPRADAQPPPRYTHGHHEAVLRSHRWRTVENSAAYLIPHLVPGTSILDIGCGPGTITLDLAERVAPAPVLGIDVAPAAIEAALAERERQGTTNAEFRTADLYALDIDDDSFDIVHAHQVLQHLRTPVAALARDATCPASPKASSPRRRLRGQVPGTPPFPQMEAPGTDVRRGSPSFNNGESLQRRPVPVVVAPRAGFTDVQPGASTLVLRDARGRAWWGELWADRITQSAIAARPSRSAPRPKPSSGDGHGVAPLGNRAPTPGSRCYPRGNRVYCSIESGISQPGPSDD